jgi:hypothetical protein
MRSTFTIVCPDAPAVVRNKLAAALTTKRPGILSGSTTFHGNVSDDGFWVVRNQALTERTMPIVATGRIAATDGGTVVTVATRPQWWVVLVLIAWSGFWVDLLWQRLVSAPLPGGIHRGEIAVIVGFLVFASGLLFCVCTIEERRYKEALTQILALT